MMVEECYEAIKGDYTEVAARYKTDDKIKKAMRKALNDGCFSVLCGAAECGDAEETLSAAQELRTICSNLSFRNLGYSVTAFAECIRANGFGKEAETLLKQVKKDYALTSACVRLVTDE